MSEVKHFIRLTRTPPKTVYQSEFRRCPFGWPGFDDQAQVVVHASRKQHSKASREYTISKPPTLPTQPQAHLLTVLFGKRVV